MAEKIIARVFRYNPSVDKEPRYERYEIPWREWITVLEVLRYIHENIEPISFDWGCRIARCGACGVQVNQQPILACVTFVQPGEITIEPLKNLPVVKDLIVDRSEVKRKLLGIRPWLVRSEPLTEIPAIPYEKFQKIEALQLCIDCLLCHAACPVLQGENLTTFAGPSIMVKIAMRYYDPRDEAKEERLLAAVREGLFECTLCGICRDVCPRGTILNAPELPPIGALEPDEAHARRFAQAPPIDHVDVFEDMQENAKKARLKSGH